MSHPFLVFLLGIASALSLIDPIFIYGAFAGFSLFFLMVLCPLPIDPRVKPEDDRGGSYRAFLLGCLFGAGFYFCAYQRILMSFFAFSSYSVDFKIISMLTILTFLALLSGLATLLTHLIKTPSVFLKALVFASLWSLAIWLAEEVSVLGFPVGYVWIKSLPLMQTTSVVGIYGLSYITLLSFLAPALLYKNRLGGALVCFVIPLGLYGWGTYRLESATKGFRNDTLVRIVQTFFPGTDSLHKETLKNLLHVTGTPKPDTKLVIWPERSVPYVYIDQVDPDFKKRHRFLNELLSLNGYTGSYAINLVHVTLKDSVPRTQNQFHYSDANTVQGASLFFDSSQKRVGQYFKRRLIPFGESFPFAKTLRPLLPADMPVIATYLTNSGEREVTQVEGLPPFLPLICYDLFFPVDWRPNPTMKPEWILLQSNDLWFMGSSSTIEMLADYSRVRSIELGLPSLRVANAGISYIADGYGRILEQLPPYTQGTMDTPIPLAAPPTFFARYGNWAFLGLMATVLLIAWSGYWLRRRSHPGDNGLA